MMRQHRDLLSGLGALARHLPVIAAELAGRARRVGSTPSGSSAQDEALVLVAYADLMRSLQVLEFSLWQIQASRLKPGITAAQAYAKVSKWDGTTFGSLVRGMKGQSHWPPGLVEELEWAVEERNHLAHHFLREYFVVSPSRAALQEAIGHLLATEQRLAGLDSRIESHVTEYAGTTWNDLNPETQAAIEAMRPTHLMTKRAMRRSDQRPRSID